MKKRSKKKEKEKWLIYAPLRWVRGLEPDRWRKAAKQGDWFKYSVYTEPSSGRLVLVTAFGCETLCAYDIGPAITSSKRQQYYTTIAGLEKSLNRWMDDAGVP